MTGQDVPKPLSDKKKKAAADAAAKPKKEKAEGPSKSQLKKEAKVTQSNPLISHTASQRYALVQLAAAAEKKKEKAAANAANANKPPAKKAEGAAAAPKAAASKPAVCVKVRVVPGPKVRLMLKIGCVLAVSSALPARRRLGCAAPCQCAVVCSHYAAGDCGRCYSNIPQCVHSSVVCGLISDVCLFRGVDKPSCLEPAISLALRDQCCRRC